MWSEAPAYRCGHVCLYGDGDTCRLYRPVRVEVARSRDGFCGPEANQLTFPGEKQ